MVFTDALTRATLATDEQLAELSRVAQKTGDRLLARAVLAVVDERGRGDLAHELVAGDEGARRRLEELRQVPDAEARQKAHADAASVIPPPMRHEVEPTPEAIQRAEQAKQEAEGERRERSAAYPPLG